MAVNNEKLYTFYVSDYHLEMIMLPYINENLSKNKNVYVFTQNNLEETINTLVEKVNLESKIKKDILNINWKNEDENKYNKLKNNNEEAIVFVKGDKEYIEKVNNNLNQIKKYKNLEIVDCYNLEEIGDNAKELAKRYKTTLITKGLK